MTMIYSIKEGRRGVAQIDNSSSWVGPRYFFNCSRLGDTRNEKPEKYWIPVNDSL
jgi:hypothetical protein